MAMGNPPDRGYSIFALDTPRNAKTIRSRLEKLKSEKIEGLVHAQDWPDYRRRVGVVEGLNEALRVCDEMEKAERA